MVIPQVIKKIDEHRDKSMTETGAGLDWARIGELEQRVRGIAAEMSMLVDSEDGARHRPKLLAALADTAMEAICVIQHFTKDLSETQAWMVGAQRRGMGRIQEAEGGGGAAGVE
jgi:hypothetical protein